MKSITYAGTEYELFDETIEKVLASANCVLLYYYPQQRLLIASDTFMQVFHTGRVFTNIPYGLELDFIMPDDFQALEELTEHINNGDESYSTLLRTRDNPISSQVTFTNIEYSEDGKPLKAIGLIQNMDDQLEKEHAYNQKLQELLLKQKTDNAIVQALSVEYESVYHLDIINNIVTPIRLSSIIERLYGPFFRSGPTYEKAFGAYVMHTVYEDDQQMLLEKGSLENLRRELSTKNVFEQQYRVLRDGSIRYFNMKVVRKNYHEQEMTGLILGFADVNEQKTRWENLLKNSLTDSLTNIGNRRAYDNAINALEDTIPPVGLGFVSIDANGLKAINDTLGHAAGDELLCGVAESIVSIFPSKECFRMGGDEFTVIHPGPKEELEQMLAALNEALDQWHGIIVEKASISAGFAHSADFPYINPIALSRRADDAMYREKNRYYSEHQGGRR